MDPQVIDQKLDSLRRCLVRIESKQPFDAGHLDDFKEFARAVSLWQAGSSAQAKN
jgi:hypothetical protein